MPALAIAVGALLALALPAAAQDDPPEPTQAVAVVDDHGVEEVEVSAGELAVLQDDPAIAVVPRGQTVQTAIARSVPHVGAPTLWAGGLTGAGTIIAVIDTGVTPTFGGTLVGQACFAANETGSVGYCGPSANQLDAFDSTCFTVGVCSGETFDAAAARPCPSPPSEHPANCAHGSAVAATAARSGDTTPPFNLSDPSGVAPDAGVYAIRVFNPQGTGADFVDLLLALDHVRQLWDAGLDIDVVNLSVSALNTVAGSCDAGAAGSAFRSAFAELLERDIVPVVASGNDYRTGSVGFPACVSNAISVGASTLADTMASFGNRGPGLDLVAPGTRSSTALTIPSGTGFQSWRGTSFSAPHVAGAFALLENQYDRANATQRTWVAKAGSVPIKDSATGATYRRLRLRAAADVLYAGVLVPQGTVAGGGTYARAGDFNGDGADDLFTYTPGSTADGVTFGGDTWNPARTPLSLSGTYKLAAGQLVGAPNGPDDVVLLGTAPVADVLLAGRADGGFDSSGQSLPTTRATVVADLDGDGWDDLVLVSPDTTGHEVRYGGAAGLSAPFPLPISSDALTVAADVDGDGQDELVHHRPGSTPDRLWQFTARGVFTSTVIDQRSSRSIAGRPIAADVDGDGDDDLMIVRSDGTGIKQRAVDGVFGSPRGTPPGAIGKFATGDLDGDGNDDVVFHGSGTKPDTAWFGTDPGDLIARPLSISGAYTPVLLDLDSSHGDDLLLVRTGARIPAWWSWGP